MKKRQSVEQVQDQQFEQRMRTFVEHRVSPSLAVTAVRDSDTMVARGYGWSDLEQGTHASAETVYLYCSMTKLFTATALMQLRERGLVELDREVRRRPWIRKTAAWPEQGRLWMRAVKPAMPC